MSRLTASVMPGVTSITVAPGLSWTAGDKIGIATTSFKWLENDYAVIVSYNNATGAITLDRKLNYYHYGAAVSTGTDYSGVDMRAEVVMFTRNV